MGDWVQGTTLSGATPFEGWDAGPDDDAPASVRFALEGALLALWADGHGAPMRNVLDASPHILRNALIPDGEVDVGDEGRRLLAAGYRAVKLKVARRSVAEDIERVVALHDAVGEEASIRLDANRGWSRSDAVAFAEGSASVPIEYVEEPVRDPQHLSDIAAQTDLPVALDETTREIPPDRLPALDFAAAVVLKPTLMGGLRTVHQWVRAARQSKIPPVISASYESGVGLRMLSVLAAAWTSMPAGLSTYDRLAADVLAPRLPLQGPTVELGVLEASDVSPDALTAV
jgi:O-succinylbenzoate synthase